MPDKPASFEENLKAGLAAVLATDPEMRLRIFDIVREQLLVAFGEGVVKGMEMAAEIADGFVGNWEVSEEQKVIATALSNGFRKAAADPAFPERLRGREIPS